MVKPERHDQPAGSLSGPMRGLWIAAGVVLTGLGIAGVILPLMPGVLFLIMAAACFARGSPRLERWLLDHPLLGPAIADWRRDRSIPKRGKIAALAGMSVSLALIAFSGAPLLAIAASGVLIGVGALYVATRPTRSADAERKPE